MAVAASGEQAAPAKKGRGLSFEEKRKRLGEYFLEKVRVSKIGMWLLILILLEGLFSIKRFGKISSKGHGNCEPIREGSFTKFSGRSTCKCRKNWHEQLFLVLPLDSHAKPPKHEKCAQGRAQKAPGTAI